MRGMKQERVLKPDPRISPATSPRSGDLALTEPVCQRVGATQVWRFGAASCDPVRARRQWTAPAFILIEKHLSVFFLQIYPVLYCMRRRSHRLRGMLDQEPGPAAVPPPAGTPVNDLAAAAAAAAGGQLWELALVRTHAHPAVSRAAADLLAIPVDGAAARPGLRSTGLVAREQAHEQSHDRACCRSSVSARFQARHCRPASCGYWSRSCCARARMRSRRPRPQGHAPLATLRLCAQALQGRT